MTFLVRDMENQFDASHILGHIVSFMAVVGAWLGLWVGIVPVMFATAASIVALIWYSLQVYESSTIQLWMRNRRARKIAYLKTQMTALEARQVFDASMDKAMQVRDDTTSKPSH